MRTPIPPVLTVIVLLLAMPARSQGTALCDAWFAEPQVQGLVAALDAMAEVGPAWDEYTVANHPVVLAGTAEGAGAGGCALVWRHGEAPERLSLAEPAPLPVRLYGFWNDDSLGADPHPLWSRMAATMARTAPEIEGALRARQDARVIVLGAPLRYDELGPLGEALEQMGMDPVVLLGRLAVHESYHLHSQFPTWFDQEARYAWPDWLAVSDRNELVATCYEGTPEVTAARAAAMDRLLATWDHLYPKETRDVEAARAEARRYVEARRARYALLDTTTVATAEGGMSCEDAEAVWELTEGSAQWVGSQTSYAASVSTLDSIRAGFVGGSNLPFYTSGSFQLWALDALLGRERFLEATRGITRSKSPAGGIFGAFVRHTTR